MIRYDIIYYMLNNFRFNNLIQIDNYSDNYLLAIVEEFNNSDYREIYKFNNHLSLGDLKFSMDCFFNHLNFNHYDCEIKGGVIDFNVDNKVRIGLNNPKSNDEDLINSDYLKECSDKGYYCYQ